MEELEDIAEKVRQVFTAKDEAREKMLPLCRDAIRYCSQSIRAIHRQEFDKATGMLKNARDLVGRASAAVTEHPELSAAGMVRDSQKELAEGYITLAIVTGNPLPKPADLQVSGAAYLNGLGEAVGEVRRYVLDAVRGGDLSRCEELLDAMDEIYSVLVTIDYPDAITGGLRRTTDMVRGVLERTRSDLTLAIRQQGLEKKLADFEDRQVQ